MKSGVLRRAIRSPHGVVTYVAWSPNGRQIAFSTGNSGHMLVYDAVRGEFINNDKEREVAIGAGIVSLIGRLTAKLWHSSAPTRRSVCGNSPP